MDFRPVRGVAILGVVALLALGGCGAWLALADSTASGCAPYVPGGTAPSRGCLSMPWLLIESGPDARSLWIELPAGQFAQTPKAIVRENASTISIEVIAQPPVLSIDGSYELTAELRNPVAGREIKLVDWTTALRFGSLAGHLVGLPRLLGLSPPQALHLLWLDGFRGRVVGHGRQVIAQIPGWGLVNERGQPDPDPHIVKLIAGSTLTAPHPPALAPGAPAGTLVGAVRFAGGPPPIPGFPRSPAAGVIDVFDHTGTLLAQPRTRAGQYFKLTLAPGTYLLSDDLDGLIPCPPTSAVVHASQTTNVDVGYGCDVP